MNEKNSFKELERLQEEQFSGNINSIKNSLDSNLGIIGIFTELIEMYFSKVTNLFINMSGGSEKEEK